METYLLIGLAINTVISCLYLRGGEERVRAYFKSEKDFVKSCAEFCATLGNEEEASNLVTKWHKLNHMENNSVAFCNGYAYTTIAILVMVFIGYQW